MNETTPVLSEDADGIRLLTLNRPDKLNAMNMGLIRGLIDAVDAAHRDDAVAALVLTGSGRAFSAGADMKEAASRAGQDAEAARRHAEATAGIAMLAGRTDKPLIAAVRGYALGGGCDLAIACDMVVAGDSAVFGYPELKRGLAATLVTPGLVRRIGPKAAFELLMLAENLPAERALALGLINRVVSDDEVVERAMEMARAMAAFDRAALRATKRVFLQSVGLDLPRAIEAAREAMLYMREAKRGG